MKWKQKDVPYTACGRVLNIPVGDIQPNPDQPRRTFAFAELAGLAQSIGENGILNPLSITLQEGKPVLVAGERRLRAAKMLGLPTVPCIVVAADERDRAVLSLIENLQRQEMNCFETAEGIRRLIAIYGLTQEEAAARLGCSQSAVANRLRLLRLGEEERAFIVERGLTERHARALLAVEDTARRWELMRRVAAGRLTVAATERLIAAVAAPKPVVRTPPIRDVRVFSNTVKHAVETMCRSGVQASVAKTETSDYIEFVVRVAK
ncbi:MAG: ParB/RepB/Spo0J family partition protein [Ruminococcaceae bacterium]|nr:ParB/RepB/Spo0J family partition protein [Oscillospiraceae bacterium]